MGQCLSTPAKQGGTVLAPTTKAPVVPPDKPVQPVLVPGTSPSLAQDAEGVVVEVSGPDGMPRSPRVMTVSSQAVDIQGGDPVQISCSADACYLEDPDPIAGARGRVHNLLRCGVPPPGNDAERAEMMSLIKLLEDPACPELDVLLKVVADVFQAPHSAITLFEDQRVWISNCVGWESARPPLVLATCPWTFLSPNPMILMVEDMRKDVRFCETVWVSRGVRAYISSPLVSITGHRMGTICFVDEMPRRVDASTARFMNNMSELAVRELEKYLDLPRRLKGADPQLAERVRVRRLARSLESLHEACVLLVDTSVPGMRLLYASDTFLQWTGCPRSAAVGRTLQELLDIATTGTQLHGHSSHPVSFTGRYDPHHAPGGKSVAASTHLSFDGLPDPTSPSLPSGVMLTPPLVPGASHAHLWTAGPSNPPSFGHLNSELSASFPAPRTAPALDPAAVSTLAAPAGGSLSEPHAPPAAGAPYANGGVSHGSASWLAGQSQHDTRSTAFWASLARDAALGRRFIVSGARIRASVLSGSTSRESATGAPHLPSFTVHPLFAGTPRTSAAHKPGDAPSLRDAASARPSANVAGSERVSADAAGPTPSRPSSGLHDDARDVSGSAAALAAAHPSAAHASLPVFDMSFRPMAYDRLDQDTMDIGIPTWLEMRGMPRRPSDPATCTRGDNPEPCIFQSVYAVRLHRARHSVSSRPGSTSLWSTGAPAARPAAAGTPRVSQPPSAHLHATTHGGGDAGAGGAAGTPLIPSVDGAPPSPQLLPTVARSSHAGTVSDVVDSGPFALVTQYVGVTAGHAAAGTRPADVPLATTAAQAGAGGAALASNGTTMTSDGNAVAHNALQHAGGALLTPQRTTASFECTPAGAREGVWEGVQVAPAQPQLLTGQGGAGGREHSSVQAVASEYGHITPVVNSDSDGEALLPLPLLGRTVRMQASLEQSCAEVFSGLTAGHIIGRGGYGVVVQAEWHDTLVAVKMQDHVFKSLEQRRLAELEISIGQQLAHPNVLRTLAFASALLIAEPRVVKASRSGLPNSHTPAGEKAGAVAAGSKPGADESHHPPAASMAGSPAKSRASVDVGGPQTARAGTAVETGAADGVRSVTQAGSGGMVDASVMQGVLSAAAVPCAPGFAAPEGRAYTLAGLLPGAAGDTSLNSALLDVDELFHAMLLNSRNSFYSQQSSMLFGGPASSQLLPGGPPAMRSVTGGTGSLMRVNLGADGADTIWAAMAGEGGPSRAASGLLARLPPSAAALLASPIPEHPRELETVMETTETHIHSALAAGLGSTAGPGGTDKNMGTIDSNGCPAQPVQPAGDETPAPSCVPSRGGAHSAPAGDLVAAAAVAVGGEKDAALTGGGVNGVALSARTDTGVPSDDSAAGAVAGARSTDTGPRDSRPSQATAAAAPVPASVAPPGQHAMADPAAAAAELVFPQRVRTWTIMELADGGTLQDAVDRGWFRSRLSQTAGPDMLLLLRTTLDIACGLEHLHSHGIVHADLSGWNVLLCSQQDGPSGATSSHTPGVSTNAVGAGAAAGVGSPGPGTNGQSGTAGGSTTPAAPAHGGENGTGGRGSGGEAPHGAAVPSTPPRGVAKPWQSVRFEADHAALHDGRAWVPGQGCAPFRFTAKLSDYGKSYRLGPGEEAVRRAEYGTITHMAPEHLAHQRVTRAVDVWAVGILMWTMYTGARPWAGLSHAQILSRVINNTDSLHFPTHNLGSSLAGHLNAEQLVAARLPTDDTWFKELAQRCMAHAPEDRPTVPQLRAQLEELLAAVEATGAVA